MGELERYGRTTFGVFFSIYMHSLLNYVIYIIGIEYFVYQRLKKNERCII